MQGREELYKIFSVRLRALMQQAALELELLQEIRLRTDKPILIRYDNKEFSIQADGTLTQSYHFGFCVSKAEVRETMEYISNYSLYAFEEEVRQAFLTIAGGHRVGIAGKIILEDGRLKTLKHIASLNVRIAHEIRGCADKVMPYIYHGKEICHTMIIAPPGVGKTTLLRDIIRQVSDGNKENKGATVGVVDERSELAACYLGIPQNNLGIRTDVLDCCPKAKGMILMLRGMAPSVIAVDEIGLAEDIDAIRYVMVCGCKIICTVHGGSFEEVSKKPVLSELILQKSFERYIVLDGIDGIGRLAAIYDGNGSLILKAEEGEKL